jgi:hypothetical protein
MCRHERQVPAGIGGPHRLRLVGGGHGCRGSAVWRDLAPEERDIIEPILNPRLGLLLT